MTQMVRKQIYIHKRQDTLLKKQAQLRQASEAELIREAIDHAIHGNAAIRPFHRDPEAWEKARRFMLARRARSKAATSPYRWKREDAYAERLSRYDRKPK